MGPALRTSPLDRGRPDVRLDAGRSPSHADAPRHRLFGAGGRSPDRGAVSPVATARRDRAERPGRRAGAPIHPARHEPARPFDAGALGGVGQRSLGLCALGHGKSPAAPLQRALSSVGRGSGCLAVARLALAGPGLGPDRTLRGAALGLCPRDRRLSLSDAAQQRVARLPLGSGAGTGLGRRGVQPGAAPRRHLRLAPGCGGRRGDRDAALGERAAPRGTALATPWEDTRGVGRLAQLRTAAAAGPGGIRSVRPLALPARGLGRGGNPDPRTGTGGSIRHGDRNTAVTLSAPRPALVALGSRRPTAAPGSALHRAGGVGDVAAISPAPAPRALGGRIARRGCRLPRNRNGAQGPARPGARALVWDEPAGSFGSSGARTGDSRSPSVC